MGPQEPTPAPFTPPNEVPSAPPTPTPIQPMQPVQQPQPMAQPFQPAPQPMQPQSQPAFQQFPAGPAPSLPPQPAKSKKGLILGLAIGGGVLLLSIIALVLWLTLFSVTKQDYQAAADKYTEVGDALEELGSTTGSSLPSNFKEKINEFGAKAKELGDLKAVRNDKDVKAAYDKVYALVPDFVKKSNTMVKFYDLTKEDCSTSKLSQQSAWEDCINALDSFDAEGWESLDKYVNAFKDLMQSYLDGKYGSTSAYSDAAADFREDTEKIGDAVKDASSELKDAINAKLK